MLKVSNKSAGVRRYLYYLRMDPVQYIRIRPSFYFLLYLRNPWLILHTTFFELFSNVGPTGSPPFNRARILKLLRSPGIDSKESILPGYVYCTTTLFLLSS